jgi:hypothetical protein
LEPNYPPNYLPSYPPNDPIDPLVIPQVSRIAGASGWSSIGKSMEIFQKRSPPG